METININDGSGLESRLHTNGIPAHSLFLAKDQNERKEKGKNVLHQALQAYKMCVYTIQNASLFQVPPNRATDIFLEISEDAFANREQNILSI